MGERLEQEKQKPRGTRVGRVWSGLEQGHKGWSGQGEGCAGAMMVGELGP